MLLEEADHRGVLLHRLQVTREAAAEIGRGARVRRNRRDAENEGAQARDDGFQDRPPRGGQGHGARRSWALDEKAQRWPFVSNAASDPTRGAQTHG